MEREDPAGGGDPINDRSPALRAFALIGLLRRELPRLKIIAAAGLVNSWLARAKWNERRTDPIATARHRRGL